MRYPVAVSDLVPRSFENDVRNGPYRASEEQQNEQPAPVSKPASCFQLFYRWEGRHFEITIHLANQGADSMVIALRDRNMTNR
jgi:hypothetical protein